MLFWTIGTIVLLASCVFLFLKFTSKQKEADTFASHVLPHGKLMKLCNRVYQVEGSLPHGMALPRNMVVYQVPRDNQQNDLILHSVIALNDEEMEKLEQLGHPNIIIVPNKLHTLDTTVYQRRYPHIKTVRDLFY